jgi:6-hydroxynicotinate 3-monooxygenase
MRIAVVGGGLGGTTAGILLQRAGFNVTVYEQAPELQRIGAGIHLHQNVTRIMGALGLATEMMSVGLSPITWLSREWDTGRILFDLPLKDWEKKYGAPHLIMHRGDLQGFLSSKLKPGTLLLNKRLVALEERSAGMVLQFSDGSRAEADIVIGADGVHSKIRELLLGPQRPCFSGIAAFRAIFPTKLLGDYRVGADVTKWWWDERHPSRDDRYFIVYYLTERRDELYFVSGWHIGDWKGELVPVPADKDEMREVFKGFHPEVQRIVEACPAASKWPVFQQEPYPLWSRDKIVMLGDACHPMKAHMGQGAGMAMEDAVILARCLEERPNDPIHAFQLYRHNRIDRASRVQRRNMTNDWLRTPDDPSWVYAYDAMNEPLRPLPESEAVS